MTRRTVLLTLPLVLLAGCGKGNFSKRSNDGNKMVLTYAVHAKPVTLDPAILQDVDTTDMLQNVYEGLVSYGEDNQIHPMLAEKWEVEDGGRTYVFHLKKGIKFHNGEPLTAADFKWTFERSCSPKVKSPTASIYLNDIVGANDVIKGNADSISGVSAPDDYTLRISIDKPRSYFIGKLTYPCAWVLCKKSANLKEMTSVAQAVGTGPYKFLQYASGQLAVLGAFDDYHGGRPILDRIERPVLLDAAARLNKYKNGELDYLQLEREQVDGVKRDSAIKSQLQFVPRAAVAYLALSNLRYAPFRDARVRQAFAKAIDVKKITNDFMGGVNLPANGILPPGLPGHREDAKYLAFDPAVARRLLAEAGYPNGRGLPPLELTIRDQTPDASLAGQAVCTMLKQNLGADVRLQTMEWRAMLEARNARKLDFYLLSWYADYLDPQNFLSVMLKTDAPNNSMGYSNPQVDAICAQADSSLDQGERMRLYAQAEDMILQDAPWIPLYFIRDSVLLSPRVKNFPRNLFGVMPHYKDSIE